MKKYLIILSLIINCFGKDKRGQYKEEKKEETKKQDEEKNILNQEKNNEEKSKSKKENNEEKEQDKKLKTSELIELCKKGDFKGVLNFFIENQEIDIDFQDENGRTALHYACIEGNKSIVAQLMIKSPKTSIRDKEGKNALHYALENNNIDAANALINFYSRWLKSGNQKMIIYYEIEAQDNNFQTPLHYAAIRAQNKIIEDLIKKASFNPNTLDKDKRTALHYAYMNNHEGTIKLLIDKTDVNIRDINNKTALEYKKKE